MKKNTVRNYIYEQPEVLRRILSEKKSVCIPFVKIFESHSLRKVYVVGSGTSYHAALSAKNYFEKLLRLEVDVVIPTVFSRYTEININGAYAKDEILVIGISQTGTSVSTIHALKKAKAQGYSTLILTQKLNSPITEFADCVCELMCGDEDVMVETKGYLATLLTIYLWSLSAGKAAGCLDEAAYTAYMQELEELLDNFNVILDESEKWYAEHKAELNQMKRGVITAYGVNYPTALEAGMKIGESYRRPVQAYEAEEFMHGPDMALNKDFYIFLIASEGSELPRMMRFREFYTKITEHVFVIGAEKDVNNKKDLRLSYHPSVHLSPLAYIVPFQLIAANLAEDNGIDLERYPFDQDFSHSPS